MVIQTVPVKICGALTLQFTDTLLKLRMPYLSFHELLCLLFLLGGVQINLPLDVDHILFHGSYLFAQLLGVSLRG